MAKKLYEESNIQAIADTIRENLPEDFAEVTYTTAEMPGGIVEACNYQSGVGFKDGCEEARHECAQKHFVHNFVGDGGTSYSFHVPFEPDVVQIMGFDQTCIKKNYWLVLVVCELRAFGLLGGQMQYGDSTSSSGVFNLGYTTASVLTRYSRANDGTITIANIGPSDKVVTYGEGVPYTAIAVKYTEQTDKERITEFVNRLTGSGSATLNQAKVNAAFTDEEWAALIAAKPDWTFSWI